MLSTVDTLVCDFQKRFTEFTNLGPASVRMYVEDAVSLHGLCDRAALYLAAHLYVLDRDQSGGGIDDGLGEVSADSIGKKSAQYMTMAERGGDTFYTTTQYGRKYLEFRRKCVGRAFSVRVY